MSLKIQSKIDNARILLDQKKIDEAINIFKKLLIDHPNNTKINFNLNLALKVKEKQSKNTNNITHSHHVKIDFDIQNINTLIDYKIAYKNLNEHIQVNSNDEQALINLGRLCCKFKFYDKAKQYLINALNIVPNNSVTHQLLGIINSKLRNFHESIFHFKQAIKINKNSIESFYYLGNLYLKLNQYSEAEKVLLKASYINNNYSDVFNSLGIAQKNQYKYDLAISNFNKAIILNANNSDYYFNLANIHSKLFNYNQAKKHYLKSISINPNISDIYNNFGNLEYNYGNYNNAYENYLLAVNKNKVNFQYLANLIGLPHKSVYFEIKNFIQSFKHYSDQFHKNKITNTNRKIIALRSFGRSGTLFLHSLIDGHKEISTLPGYFFKGWFGKNIWEQLKPDYTQNNWRELLAENIFIFFEPQFNASKKGNVPGSPNKTSWLAQSTGFTSLGKNSDEILNLDKNKFITNFIDLIKNEKSINQRECFELVHDAFDTAYRLKNNEIPTDLKIIFYHIHNPDNFELLNFSINYPDAKMLFIIRHPIQSLESWLKPHFDKIFSASENVQILEEWHEVVKTIQAMFYFFLNPINTLTDNYGIKLEDLKIDTDSTIQKISDFIGIKKTDSLFNSEFLNYEFSRPSTSQNKVSGFSTEAIDLKIGRYFSSNDIKILNHIFYNFLDKFKYSNNLNNKIEYEEVLKIIKVPFDFEKKIYSCLKDSEQSITEYVPYKLYRKFLFKTFEIIKSKGGYPVTIKYI